MPQQASETAKVSSDPSPTSQDVPAKVTYSAPVGLEIASINVNAPIVGKGLTPSGDMDIDDTPETVAWYNLGPKPGEKGSAVLAGHYGWKNNVPSVFNDLHTLKPGDTLSVTGQDGKKMSFAVVRSAVYKPDENAKDVFRSNDGKAHLNLITCQGSWNSSQKTYSERLVVFTDHVE